ncbi:AarF/UbiB family protein [bacterium]|nr:AarF/UbiB family protein [bacterium]
MNIPRIDRGYRNLKRYRQIVGILIKYGFAEIIDRMNLRVHLQIKRRLRKGPVPDDRLSAAERIRLVLEELGPTFIKLGQLLSTRSFLIPADLLNELTKLQDEVKPVPFDQIQEYVENEFGESIEKKFEDFKTDAIASASIAQVHRATTRGGAAVVVKIQRPEVARLIATDLDILADIARLMDRFVPESRQFDPEGVVRELTQTTKRELDFINEGRNVELFAKNFVDFENVYVPKVFWEHTTEKILTTEYIDGIKISDLRVLEASGCDPKFIAQIGARFILKQVFDDGFFHADPHPGNLFIKDQSVIVPVDFGMMGRLDETLMEEVSDLLIGAVQKDADLIIRVLVNLGSLDEEQDARAVRVDIAHFVDRYYGASLKQIKMQTIIADVFALVTKHELRTPSNLLLLMKTLGTYEDIARRLDPEFEIFSLAKPYVSKLVWRRLDMRKIAYQGFKTLRDLYDLAKVLPRELELLLRKIKRGQFAIELQDRGLQNLMLEIDRASNRVAFSLIIAALIVGSSLILNLGTGPIFLGYPLFGILGFLFAGILGVWLVIAILRSGRL